MATTLELIKKLSKKGAKPETLAEIAKWFDYYKAKFGVTTAKRQAAFLSQAAHETDGFRALTEYASGQAYEGRKDLGNIVNGDGVRYKGRGIFMVTGRNNYRNYSKAMFGDDRLVLNPTLLAVPQWAVLSAFHYWKDHNLNAKADAAENSVLLVTKAINGGTNGIEERQKFYAMAIGMVSNNPIVSILVAVLLISLLFTYSK